MRFNKKAFNKRNEKGGELKGVKYKRAEKEDNASYEFGYIAQDVETVLPELVIEMNKGNLKGLNYNGFVPNL